MSLKQGLLGLLNYAPMTGYELTKVFNDSLQFFWKAQTSQIYRDLNNLEKDGYLSSSTEEQSGKPDKRIYTITEKGLSYFREWLNDYDFSKESKTRESMLMKIFFSAQGDNNKLKNSLFDFIQKSKEYKQHQLKVIEIMKDYASENEELKVNYIYWRIVHARGLVQADANITWGQMAIDILENGVNDEYISS